MTFEELLEVARTIFAPADRVRSYNKYLEWQPDVAWLRGEAGYRG